MHNKLNIKKFLIAVSGGPDSMALLDIYRKKHKIKAVIHINYNFRHDSKIDENIVRRYCRKYHIRLFIKKINKNIYSNYKISNFENWARNKRYRFFRLVANKINCKNILMGHHKDDFIETALLQIRANKERFFYGMNSKQKYFDLNIYRPFLHTKYKKELQQYCCNKKIKFAVDYTNFDTKYSRNKIRNTLNKNIKQKKNIYKIIKRINLDLKFRIKKYLCLFRIWKNNLYDVDFFKKIGNSYKWNLIKIFLYDQKIKNISKNKTNSIINFLNSSNNNKNLRIEKNTFLKKINKKVIKIIYSIE